MRSGHLIRLERRERMSNAQVYNLLKGLKTEMILYLMICTSSKTAIKRISRYHTRLRNAAITLSGKDLVAMGYPPGPLFSKTLQAVLEAKLNGQVRTRKEELNHARKTIQRLGEKDG